MSESPIPILENLNTEQKSAVQATEGPVLVLAGAGSGKTRVLTHRIAYLIQDKGVQPWQILAMTFTKKAAGEMVERVHELVTVDAVPWIGTFHSIFSKLLRIEAQHLNYDSNFVIYDTDDQLRLMKSLMSFHDISTQQFAPKSILATISKSKNNLIEPQDYAVNALSTPFEKMVARLYPAYENQLRANNAMDFDDLIKEPITLFEKNPEILEKYQNRFKYILVDEYQDTNRVQYRLLQLLSKSHQNLCVVGDDDQSIYGWRGADINNILDFEKDFPSTQTYRLEQNYRSTKNILTAANAVASRNVGRKEKSLWCEQADGEKIDAYETLNGQSEALKIVNNLKHDVFKHKRSFRDFAILYRTNAQSRAVEDALRRNAISYIIVGGVRFYERKEIKDILAYLKVIVNPKDEVSLRRIINFPTRGIGDTTIQRLIAYAREHQVSLINAVEQCAACETLSKAAQKRVSDFNELMQKYIELKDKISVSELVHTLVDEIGFVHLYKEDLGPDSQSRLENIQELMNAVTAFEVNSEEDSLAGFLEEVALVADIDQWDDKNNAVTLMTLHSAKGLEFPVVFIAGMEEGLLPVSRSLDNPTALEEERRLFYVGITRAREKLYLTWAKQRNLYGEDNYRVTSRFLKEIDPLVVEFHQTKMRKETFEPSGRSPFRKKTSSFDKHPEYESYSQETSYITPGSRVEHAKFGQGKILDVTGGGAKQTLTILFDNGERKKLLTQYANLTLLGS